MKCFEGSVQLMGLIKVYNKQIQDQIIGCGAYHKKKVESITAKHLALSANCVRFMLKEVLPNFR